jgi:hypothetical protein
MVVRRHRRARQRGPWPGVDDVPNVPARRQLVSATENITNRDEQARTFAYDLALFTDDGEPVVISGRDLILDGDEELKVFGTPDTVARRRRPHHIQARAYVIEG